MAAPVVIRIRSFIKDYPVVKGMVTYAVLWPISNICQQTIQGREQYNFVEAARFSIFGSFVVAPSLYAWVRIAGRLIPGNTLKIAMKKALLEQVLYSPFAITTFYSGMCLLENKSLEEVKTEVQAKFWPTYRTGICIWPLVQTINFAFIKERNRVPVTSVVSFFWTVFLSYMKQKELKRSTLKN
ncbi:unnamed protein product [Orchesella dallaii]|uniref:Mpv17-like protein n=1 Tax=Orchesella dallaii TaxID=48710 RepID=A0ABP1RTX1_9HEXA